MKTIQDARKAFDALKRVYVLTGSQVAQTLDSFLSRLESKIPQTWLGVSNDDEGFILDNAMQHGFEMLDDDGDLFLVPAPELIHYTRVQREPGDNAEQMRADFCAAIDHAVTLGCAGAEFLRHWNEGEWDACREYGFTPSKALAEAVKPSPSDTEQMRKEKK